MCERAEGETKERKEEAYRAAVRERRDSFYNLNQTRIWIDHFGFLRQGQRGVSFCCDGKLGRGGWPALLQG